MMIGVVPKMPADAEAGAASATLAMTNPNDVFALDDVRRVLGGVIVKPVVVTEDDFRRFIETSYDAIVEGSDIATPLIASNAFPSMVGYMIATGEQSGQLEEILERIAEAYEEEVDIATQRMTAVLEPIIIIALASVVLFVVLAIVTPLLQMSSLAGK